ncbi:hypothetical protein LOOC260_100210 [Paucilactobacillus hokkaidonensis JCM 18461]|uniref:Uncharacterized protein n=1 Tax=Paucilactobacillus hokkaidonensis JCM 18461 TaxID=1291742 RepID=A0A0A1GW56_9LACO|nr:hypothetical protein [Paucilactobacillus hokkaidonensis]BAP84601.1 hypothetical protein LOOC260_100210 [Paucilactobacillus hokkaidonensis JCM 18461]
MDRLTHLCKLVASVKETKQMLDIFSNNEPNLVAYDEGLALLDYLNDP